MIVFCDILCLWSVELVCSVCSVVVFCCFVCQNNKATTEYGGDTLKFGGCLQVNNWRSDTP